MTTTREVIRNAHTFVHDALKGFDAPYAYIDFDDDGEPFATNSVATIFTTTPSGKLYAPFAMDNLAPCPRCRGTGKVRNRKAHAWRHKLYDARAAEVRAAAVRGYGYWRNGKWPRSVINEVEWLEHLASKYASHSTCSWCAGTGSREAYLDSVWWGEVHSEANELAACIVCDGSDIFVTRPLPSNIPMLHDLENMPAGHVAVTADGEVLCPGCVEEYHDDIRRATLAAHYGMTTIESRQWAVIAVEAAPHDAECAHCYVGRLVRG